MAKRKNTHIQVVISGKDAVILFPQNVSEQKNNTLSCLQVLILIIGKCWEKHLTCFVQRMETDLC